MSDQTSMNGTINKQALLAKYLAERDKRLRADGNAQYLRLEGQLSHYKRDPYAEPINREALFDHVTFAFVGGGIAGLVTGARLVEAGMSPTSASSRRAAISAAPGTGIVIPARNATPPRWSTCPCSRKPGTCHRRNTRTVRKSSSNAAASAASSRSTTMRCSRPR